MEVAGGSPTFTKHRCVHPLLLQTWQRNTSESAWTCPRRRRRGNKALPKGQSCKQPGLVCRRWPWPIALEPKASGLCGPWTWEAWKMHGGWWGSTPRLPAPGPSCFPLGLHDVARLQNKMVVSWRNTLCFKWKKLKPQKLDSGRPWEAPSVQFHSVQFSHSVMCDSLWPRGLQHARPPCLSPTPGACSNSCRLSQWCHPTISSSVVPFSFCLQSFPASGSFQMSQFFASSGQSIGVSASSSVLPMNIQDWFPLEWTGWISLQSKGFSRVFSNTTVQKHVFFGNCFLYSPTLTSIHDYWKNHSFD